MMFTHITEGDIVRDLVMRGVIERRLLVNYRVDPDVVAAELPEPFEPQLVNGYAVAGICLIRLAELRPRALPHHIGLRTENAAHRFAVQWHVDGERRTGVYIPIRHTASRATVTLGDRLFPGYHLRADFTVTETPSRLEVAFRSHDDEVSVDVEAEATYRLGGSSLFDSVADASAFFRTGATGYSPTRDQGILAGVELRSDRWNVEPLQLRRVRSSVFDDPTRFPPGSITLDSALAMRNVPVDWHAVPARSPFLGAAAGAG
jgi:hypothetical protein